MADSRPSASHTVNTPLRLMVADDDAASLNTLAASLRARDDVELIGAVKRGSDVIKLLGHNQVDVVFLDINLPGIDGAAPTQSIKASYPHIPVVMFTHGEFANVFGKTLSTGVSSFIRKDLSVDALVKVLYYARTGAPVMGTQPLNILIKEFLKHQSNEDMELRQAINELPQYLRKVLDEIIAGNRNRVIGAHLQLKDSTVRSYISELFQRTGCATRVELAARTSRLGFGDEHT